MITGKNFKGNLVSVRICVLTLELHIHRSQHRKSKQTTLALSDSIHN